VNLRPGMRARSGTGTTAAAISFAAAVAAVGAYAHAETIRVEVKSLAFLPAQVTAHVGDTIEWSNADFIAHTATAKNRDWDVQLPANSKKTLVLKKAGTVEYFCRFHPNMTGTLTVEEAKR
jgi:plastocyanin